MGALFGGKGTAGTVTAINGSTITIAGRNKAAYTIDASRGTITSGIGKGTTTSVSAIALGDHIMALGTLTGSSVAATSIRDMGKFQPGSGAQNWKKNGQ